MRWSWWCCQLFIFRLDSSGSKALEAFYKLKLNRLEENKQKVQPPLAPVLWEYKQIFNKQLLCYCSIDSNSMSHQKPVREKVNLKIIKKLFSNIRFPEFLLRGFINYCSICFWSIWSILLRFWGAMCSTNAHLSVCLWFMIFYEFISLIVILCDDFLFWLKHFVTTVLHK